MQLGDVGWMSERCRGRFVGTRGMQGGWGAQGTCGGHGERKVQDRRFRGGCRIGGRCRQAVGKVQAGWGGHGTSGRKGDADQKGMQWGMQGGMRAG